MCMISEYAAIRLSVARKYVFEYRVGCLHESNPTQSNLRRRMTIEWKDSVCMVEFARSAINVREDLNKENSQRDTENYE